MATWKWGEGGIAHEAPATPTQSTNVPVAYYIITDPPANHFHAEDYGEANVDPKYANVLHIGGYGLGIGPYDAHRPLSFSHRGLLPPP